MTKSLPAMVLAGIAYVATPEAAQAQDYYYDGAPVVVSPAGYPAAYYPYSPAYSYYGYPAATYCHPSYSYYGGGYYGGGYRPYYGHSHGYRPYYPSHYGHGHGYGRGGGYSYGRGSSWGFGFSFGYRR